MPGTVWGPGWVAWRTGDAYVGWAPLPPGVDYTDAGDLAWGDIDLMDDPYANYWVFVAGRLFLGRGSVPLRAAAEPQPGAVEGDP